MDKMANFVNLVNAINLVLDEGVGIGHTFADGKYAYISNEMFEENFSGLTWEIETKYNKRIEQDLTFAYVSFAGVKFGTSVDEDFREKHKDRPEFKEAVA